MHCTYAWHMITQFFWMVYFAMLCMCECRCLWGTGKGVSFQGVGFMGSCEPCFLMWILGSGSVSLKEERVRLTAEPSLQTHMALFADWYFHGGIYYNINKQPPTLGYPLPTTISPFCSPITLVSYHIYTHPWCYVSIDIANENKLIFDFLRVA